MTKDRIQTNLTMMVVSESLAAPKIGTVLRFRDKWQKCPYLAPIFTFWGGKIGAPLRNNFAWQKSHDLAPILPFEGVGKQSTTMILTLHGKSAQIWLRFLQFEGGNLSTTMNVRTCTSTIRRIFIAYCSVGYLCPDFAPIYHLLGGCPDFYFSSLKTLP